MLAKVKLEAELEPEVAYFGRVAIAFVHKNTNRQALHRLPLKQKHSAIKPEMPFHFGALIHPYRDDLHLWLYSLLHQLRLKRFDRLDLTLLQRVKGCHNHSLTATTDRDWS